MKKIYLLLILCIILVLPNVYSEVNLSKYIFYDGGTKMINGSDVINNLAIHLATPSSNGWVWVKLNTAVLYYNTSNGYNSSFRIYFPNNGIASDNYQYVNLSMDRTNITYEWDFYASNSVAADSEEYLYSQSSETSVGIKTSKFVYLPNATSGWLDFSTPYSVGWHHARIMQRINTQAYVCIDSECILVGTNTNYGTLYLHGYNTKNFSIANIKVYRGNVTPADLPGPTTTPVYSGIDTNSVNNTKDIILNISCYAGNVSIWFDKNNTPSVKRITNQTTPYYFNFSSYVDTQTTYYLMSSCDNGLNNYSSVFNWTYDYSMPNYNTTFTSNKIYFQNQTITFDFVFKDNDLIHTVNLTILPDNKIIYYNTGINNATNSFYSNYSSSNLTKGYKNLSVYFADGHTAKRLKDADAYNPELCPLGDCLEYKIKQPYLKTDIILQLKDGSVFDNWQFEEKIDRYTETIKPYNKKSTQTIKVTATQKIYIAEKEGSFGGRWLIIGNHWKDFVMKNQPNGKIKNINIIDDYNVEVELEGITNTSIIEFESTGDLNIQQYYLPFAVDNLTLSSVSTNPTGLGIDEQDINGYANATDGLGYNVYFNYVWYNGDTILKAYNQTTNYSSAAINLINTLNNSNTSNGYSIKFSVQAMVTNYNSTWLNSSILPITSISLFNCTNQTNITANFSIIDEISGALVTATTTGFFNYSYLYNPTTYYTLNLNKPGSNNFTLCIYPPSIAFNVEYTLYSSGDVYPQRRFYGNFYANNVTQLFNLSLLNTSIGIYGRFKTLSIYEQVLSGVNGLMRKSGSSVISEQEQSDSAGLMTFFVNPNQDYNFYFTKDGYLPVSTTQRITTTDIASLLMTPISNTTPTSSSAGIIYSFTPTNNQLNNATTYNFTFNLSSSILPITYCQFRLKNDTNIIFTTSTYTSSLCNGTLTYNVGDKSYLIAEGIYNLNNTGNLSVSKRYTIRTTYQGTFSLKTAFDDLENFTAGGFDYFTKFILGFLLILLVVYLANQSINITSETTIILIWIMVFFFSYLGWFNVTLGNNPDWFPNINQWFIFVIDSLFTAAYLMWRH